MLSVVIVHVVIFTVLFDIFDDCCVLLLLFATAGIAMGRQCGFLNKYFRPTLLIDYRFLYCTTL